MREKKEETMEDQWAVNRSIVSASTLQELNSLSNFPVGFYHGKKIGKVMAVRKED